MLGSYDFKKKTMEVVIGRNKDQTLRKQLVEHGTSGTQEEERVKLKYADKAGNTLTLK